MATSETTNLQLVKYGAGTDNFIRTDYNGNLDKIDTFAGNTNEAIGNLNAENEYNGASAASLTAAIEAAIDALSNDSKMHVITVTKWAKVILLVQKYSSGSYASYVGYCYALTNPINGEKVNGTWTHSTLALKSEVTDVSDGTSFTMTAYNANLTINEQYCRSYGKLKFVYVKFTTSTSITSWSHLINLGFNTACPWYGNIFNPTTGKFLTDTIVYSDANNTTLRNYTPLAAGTYAVSFVAVAS